MTNDKIPVPLLHAFEENRIVVFLGSGFSANFGFPMFLPLLNSLRDAGFVQEENKAFFDELEILQKAQYLINFNGRQSILNSIKQLFPKITNATDFSLFDLLFSLPTYKLYTTNWDTLIESAYRQTRNSEMNVRWKDKQFSAGRELELIKLHGTIDDFESIVFSEDDYFNFINKNSLLLQQLKVDIANKMVLFLGYSLNDINLKLIINQIRHSLGELVPSIHMFCANFSQNKLDFLKAQNIKPVCYYGNDYAACLTDFLSELVNRVGKTAKEPKKRALIIFRENSKFLNRRHLTIRNSSNLGPLSTPLDEKLIYIDEDLTAIEQNCTRNWIQIIENSSNKAKCVISLDERLLFSQYDKGILKKRLLCLKQNILRYTEKVTFTDRGYMIDTNFDIYGDEVMLESRKYQVLTTSYNYIKVIKNPSVIREEINSFDSLFNSLQKYNKCQDNSDVLQKLNNLISKL